MATRLLVGGWPNLVELRMDIIALRMGIVALRMNKASQARWLAVACSLDTALFPRQNQHGTSGCCVHD
jgi:hypothetical protein